MDFGIPQIIWISLVSMELGICLVKNGQPKTDKYSFGWSLFSVIVSSIILYFGGFFG